MKDSVFDHFMKLTLNIFTELFSHFRFASLWIRKNQAFFLGLNYFVLFFLINLSVAYFLLWKSKNFKLIIHNLSLFLKVFLILIYPSN